MPSEETVSFNVGGRIFQVRRSLLEAHPSTLLARSASDEWHAGDKPIFIDRDADRFRYCLDFMRDGEVQLPHTESKDSLLKDLEYYGLCPVHPDSISIKFPVFDAMKCLASAEKEFDDEIALAEVEAETAMARLMHMKVARACFAVYKRTMKKRFCYGSHLSNATQNELLPWIEKLKLDQLNDYLKKFDLQAVDHGLWYVTVEPLVNRPSSSA